MAPCINRFDFLRGRLDGGNRPIRPPWSESEADFIELCNQCGDCIDLCPTGIIRNGRGGYPVIEFRHGECLFCGECLKACKTDALKPDQTPAWPLAAKLNSDKCIAYESVECRGCYDPCETRAITMQYRVGAIAIPIIESNRCNGCGACFAPCPVAAIEIQNPMEVTA